MSYHAATIQVGYWYGGSSRKCKPGLEMVISRMVNTLGTTLSKPPNSLPLLSFTLPTVQDCGTHILGALLGSLIHSI